MTHTIKLVSGVGGLSVYINNYRVAGPKPWGGGQQMKEWKVEDDIVREALKQPPEAP